MTSGETLLGPFGTYFGRSIAQVESRLVWWTVPFSGGKQIRVHEEMFPALEDVAEGLHEHALEGRVYPITSVGGFVPRTIGGRYQISRHALGLAIDMNPAQNPFRSDGALITNMPSWFVETWEDAGFCWGGRWLGVKDPMHFSWMGPRSTPDPTDSLQPSPPFTTKTAFTQLATKHQTEFAPVIDRYEIAVTDGSGNGAADVVGLRTHEDGAVLDIASSMRGFGYCSVFRWFVPDVDVSDVKHFVLADLDADSGQDMVAVVGSGGSFQAITATRTERFEDPTTIELDIGAPSAIAAADFDGDGVADLWESDQDGDLTIWAGPELQSPIGSVTLDEGAPLMMAAGDRDGGNTPELFVAYADGSGTRIDVLSPDSSWQTETSISLEMPASDLVAIGAGDYDGDGRADLETLSDTGTLEVHIGNSSTGIPANRWFLNPDWDCNQLILLDYNGLFMDDETSIFESHIDSIGTVGVTRGCNPPFNDQFCPDDSVTRGQMAALLVRALDLPEGNHPGFADVEPDSTFVNDINKLAAAGITKGCNPPANTLFCPDDPVTRAQMAAFLVRALGLQANDHPGFVDVAPTSTFVLDIGKLATEGITKGCNPPQNDQFCPNDSVTRGQMAAFLDRAGLGAP